MEFLDVSLDSLIQKKPSIRGKGNDGGKRKTFNNKGSSKVVVKAAGPRKFVGKALTQPYAVSRRPSSASSVSRPSSAISSTHNNNFNNNNNLVRPASFISSTAAAAAAAAEGNILNRLGVGNSSTGSGTMITISNLNLDILPRSEITSDCYDLT